MSETSVILDINKIMEILPHRYPFLLVDRVSEIGENGGKGYKNVSINEPFFQGHFPGRPVMPGVLIIEGLAQFGGLIAVKLLEKQGTAIENSLFYFMMIDKAKFRQPVFPGDRLDFEVDFMKLSSKVIKFLAKAYVAGNLAAEAELTAMMNVKS